MSRSALAATATSGPARWAVVSGAAGLVAGLTLILFFALAAPLDDHPSPWDWLGPANDLSGALQSAALVPVALALPFAVQAPLVTTCIFLQFGWLFAVSRAGRRTGALPTTVARSGTLTGLTLAGAVALAAPALLLPQGSTAQYLLLGAAVVPGMVAWLGLPVWTVLLARSLADNVLAY